MSIEGIDPAVAVRLRRVCKLAGVETAVPASDEELLGCMFSVLGIVARALTAKSAVEQHAEAAFQIVYKAYSTPADKFADAHAWAIFQHGLVIDAFTELQHATGRSAAWKHAVRTPQESGAGHPHLPHPGSTEASAMIDQVLAEYDHPANSKNAARAGFEAARRLAGKPPATSLAFQHRREQVAKQMAGVYAAFAEPQEPPLTGRWHHGNGALCCGSLRIARADFDSNPPEAVQVVVLEWIVATLNAALVAKEKS
jgi:hypothetical protein